MMQLIPVTRLLIAADATAKAAKDAGKSISKGWKKMWSDVRLKENIKFAYAQQDMNVYTYNYIWSKEIQKGVMAQELLGTKYAGAVEIQDNGFYMVDYDKLPKELH